MGTGIDECSSATTGPCANRDQLIGTGWFWLPHEPESADGILVMAVVSTENIGLPGAVWFNPPHDLRGPVPAHSVWCHQCQYSSKAALHNSWPVPSTEYLSSDVLGILKYQQYTCHAWGSIPGGQPRACIAGTSQLHVLRQLSSGGPRCACLLNCLRPGTTSITQHSSFLPPPKLVRSTWCESQ